MKLTTYKRIAIYYYWLIVISAITCLLSILGGCTYRINKNCEIRINQHNGQSEACISCDSLLSNLLLKTFKRKQ